MVYIFYLALLWRHDFESQISPIFSYRVDSQSHSTVYLIVTFFYILTYQGCRVFLTLQTNCKNSLMEGDIEWAKTKPEKKLINKNRAINKASKSFPWNVQKMKETLSYNINHQNRNWTEIKKIMFMQ